MNFLRNEKGVTLIEVLTAAVILSIVLISIMNVFPQMSIINKVNGNKSQAILTAKKELIKWEDDISVKNYLKGDASAVLPAVLDHSDTNYYYFKNYQTSDGNYDVKVIIATAPPQDYPLQSTSQVRFIQVQILNNNSVVSETYGYIIL